EVRPVGHLERRIRTAKDLGFETVVGPARTREGGSGGKVAWTASRDLSEAIKAVFGVKPAPESPSPGGASRA
ncbi:MAG: hypothetical protein ACOC25_09640, partial [Alkalispirochaetaceae bacterium]